MMNNSPSTVLAANLLEFRRLRNLSLRDLADASGTSVGALSRIESGSANPRLVTLTALADVLAVSVDDLLRSPVPEARLVRRRDMERRRTSGSIQVVAGQLTLGGTNLYISWVTFGRRPKRLGSGAVHHLLVHAGTVEVYLDDEKLSAGPGDYLRVEQGASLSYGAKGGLAMALFLEEPRG